MGQKRRTHWTQYLKPFQRLKAEVENSRGEKQVVQVKLGGFLSVYCKVKVNRKLVFKDKYRIPIIG